MHVLERLVVEGSIEKLCFFFVRIVINI